MRRLRTLSSRRLIALAAAFAVLVASAAVAQAGLIGSDPKPEPKPLDRAIADAVNAPVPDGVTARISFTNGLLPSGSLSGGSTTPLLTGADGRLWLARDGRLRLELQSERGDAQIVSDGRRLTVYDATSKTLYRVALPQDGGGEKPEAPHGPVSVATVRRGLDRLAQAWTLSGAQPTSTGGRPSYTLRIAPKDDGGLLGAGELAWDAEKGVPLRAAIYAQGQADPVAELEATDVSFGPVAAGDLEVQAPADAEVVEVDPPAAPAKGTRPGADLDVTGVAAVQRRLGFRLAAPDELAGLPRKEVRLVRFGGGTGALSVYGEGLGGILVLQREAGEEDEQAPDPDALPRINIDGVTGTEIATALGTLVRFERAGVSYTVLGSVPPVAAENAARDLR